MKSREARQLSAAVNRISKRNVWCLKKNTTTDWQINGHMGRLATDPAAPPSVEVGPDRVWIIEPVDKNLKALNVPRTLGTEVISWFYIKDLANDQLVVQTQRVDMLGDRKVWDYQEFKIPGAGTVKVNLANGNLHYEMVDADMPSRKWNDILKRSYDSQSSINTNMGTGWTSVATPRLKFFDNQNQPITFSDQNSAEVRVEYWRGVR